MRTITPSTPSPATSPALPALAPKSLLLTASMVSNGAGGYRVVPGKPVMEIGTKDAARLLGMSRGSLGLVLETPFGRKHLRWRWLTAKKGKRVFDLASVAAYREALQGWSEGLG